MKQSNRAWWGGACVAAVASSLLFASGSTGTNDKLASDRSYAVGWDLGMQALATLNADGVTVHPEALVRGFKSAIEGSEPEIDTIEMRAILTHLEREVATRWAERRMIDDPVFEAQAELNRVKGEQMLAKFEAEDGTRKLPSGVLYRVLEKGAGNEPSLNDVLLMTFELQNADGELIASGVRQEVRGRTMIDGAQQIIPLMRAGSRFRVAFPAEQAFGIGGLGTQIGPNEALIADVTLIEVR